MATLSAGHLTADLCQGALPALLPFLISHRGYSYGAASALVLAATVSSSVIQPLFGHLSDRHSMPWLMPLGLLLGGIGIGLVGIAPSYALTFASIVVSGLGVAAFHPEGAKFAAFASGRRPASGMALFNIGGNTGYALGPLVVTPLMLWLGLDGAALVAPPIALGAAALWWTLPYLRGIAPPRPRRDAEAPVAEQRGAVAVLLAVVVLRSVAFFGLLTFAPLYLASRGEPSHWLLALMLLAGAGGTLTLGPVADRIGLRRTLLVTQAAIAPLIVVFIVEGGAWGTLALMGVAVCVVGTYGVTMVLSQQYLPRHVALASGLNVGLAVGLGGVAAVCLGLVADAVDLRSALALSAAAPVLGVLLCLLLPAPAARRRLAVEPVAP